jgi:hypothetical protein
MESFESLIRSIPLIEPESSLRGIQPELGQSTGGSLYFGTGLTTSKAMSVGVPFDVLGMLLVAENIRRALGLEWIIQLIADTHAKSNPFCKTEEVDAMATKMSETCKRMARLLGIEEHYVSLKSSGIDNSPDYLEIFGGIRTEDHEYVRREWADIEYLRRHRNLRLKLSWTIGSKVNKVGFDERLYDLRFRDVMGQTMSFMYLWPGRTLDKQRPKVSPYISIAGEQRILFAPNENVESKLSAAELTMGADSLKGVKEHLHNIIQLFEGIHGPLAANSTEEKVQAVINMAFAD